MKRCVDLVIVGAGFGGSLMAMIAHRLGLSVVLLEQGSHPRMAVGESTTPLSNLLLEQLSATYDLPRIAPLAKWGSWQAAYPQLGCGLKRGFSFFAAQGRPLLVAASPHDTIADTHWYRADVDHFLVNEARALGVTYYDQVWVDSLRITEDAAVLTGHSRDETLLLHAGRIIDATGPRGFLHRTLQWGELPLPGFPATESLYSHFTGVGYSPLGLSPYPVDDAAVHHIFPGGWVWVLRFSNGITSAGVAATAAAAQELRLSEGEPAWQRLLGSLPALGAQFRGAQACQPFRYLPKVSFRSQTIAGPRCVLLPSAAGFVDPLLSSGFALTLLGIERLTRIFTQRSDAARQNADLQEYARQTDDDLLAVSSLIRALYATMGNFEAFKAVSLLYFAAVSFSETALRLGKRELAPGFLLSRHPGFGPGAARLLQRAQALTTVEATQTFHADVLHFIEPFNLGGFGESARQDRYAVVADDLLKAAPKLGVTRIQVAAMLKDSGFYELSPEPPAVHR